MQRLIVAKIAAGMLIALGAGSSICTQAAAPAPSSYFAVEKTISSVRDAWSRAGAVADPNAPGWNVFFDALLNDLRHVFQDRQPDRPTGCTEPPLPDVGRTLIRSLDARHPASRRAAAMAAPASAAGLGRGAGLTTPYAICRPPPTLQPWPTASAGSTSSPTIWDWPCANTTVQQPWLSGKMVSNAFMRHCVTANSEPGASLAAFLGAANRHQRPVQSAEPGYHRRSLGRPAGI